MTALLDRIRKEPAVVLGIVAAVLLAVIQTLAGNGVIKPDLAATVIGFFDNQATPAALDGWGYPILLGLVTRFFVYSPPTVKVVAANAAATGDPTVHTSPP